VKEWNTFQIAPFKTKSSILMCASVRLAPFDIPSVARLTSKDTLELDTLGDEKTVLFVCLSDTSGTFNFLSAIMFKVLFESLVYKADEVYRGELPIPVQCILDEWANIGQIPEFEKLMSTIRSRGISVGIILQALSQLKRLHKDSWEEIMGNCSTLVYLGGKEESTHKYISKLLGKETIDTLSYSRSYGAQGSYTKQMNRTGRELLTSDEVAGIPKDKCIVITAENLKYLSSKYDLKKHPNYHYLYDANKENWYDYQISYSPVEEFLMNTATLEIFDHEVFKAA
jgi:type IV secretion system protein VirD4